MRGYRKHSSTGRLSAGIAASHALAREVSFKFGLPGASRFSAQASAQGRGEELDIEVAAGVCSGRSDTGSCSHSKLA